MIYIYYSYSNPQKKERHAMLVDVLCLLASLIVCSFLFFFHPGAFRTNERVKNGIAKILITNGCLFFLGGGCGGASSPRPTLFCLSFFVICPFGHLLLLGYTLCEMMALRHEDRRLSGGHGGALHIRPKSTHHTHTTEKKLRGDPVWVSPLLSLTHRSEWVCD